MKIQIECETLIQNKQCPKNFSAGILKDILSFISSVDQACGFSVGDKYSDRCRFIELEESSPPLTFDKVASLLLGHASLELKFANSSKKGKPLFVVESVTLHVVEKFQAFLDSAVIHKFNKGLEESLKESQAGRESHWLVVHRFSEFPKLTTPALQSLLEACREKLALEPINTIYHRQLQELIPDIQSSLAARAVVPNQHGPRLPFMMDGPKIQITTAVDPLLLAKQAFLSFYLPYFRKATDATQDPNLSLAPKQPLEQFLQRKDGIGDGRIVRKVFSFLCS